MTQQSQSLAEVGAENDQAVAGVPVSTSHDSDAVGVAPDAGREDLTVFFSIGLVVNVLMVTVFLVWAVRQWRKTGNRS